jgi:hypothetical protein
MKREMAYRTGTTASQRPGIVFLLLTLLLLVGGILLSGCIAAGKDPVVGTWEWSDGKGYTERYTFGEDHAFQAEALGSGFSGTWELVAPGQYEVTYRMTNLPGQNETRTDRVLYDSKTDAIYFPAHRRVT